LNQLDYNGVDHNGTINGTPETQIDGQARMNGNRARRGAKWDADKAEEKREREANRKADKMESKADKEELLAKMDYNQEKTETAINSLRSCLEVTHACLVERKEPAPEEIKAVAETAEVPEGATDEEAIGVNEDRSRNLRLAVRCRGHL
jgi:hypothetical protein